MKKEIINKPEILNNKQVVITKKNNKFKATIEFKGRLHQVYGYSEKEAEENLYEYLINEIGI